MITKRDDILSAIKAYMSQINLTSHGLRKGDEHRTCTPHRVRNTSLYLECLEE